MTKQKSTKKTLLTSVLSLVLCVAMLIGTTFAWFTDSVISGGNKIQAGTLDIKLYHSEDASAWNEITNSSAPIFNYQNWEPGYTDVNYLKIENAGTLALMWQAQLETDAEITALANVIDVYVTANNTGVTKAADFAAIQSDWKKAGTLADFIEGFANATRGNLYPKGNADNLADTAYLGIALHMQETAGNEYQGMTLGGDFDIVIKATQLPYEADSFNNQYDADAPSLVYLNGKKYASLADALAVATAADTIQIAGTVRLAGVEGTSQVTDLKGIAIEGTGEDYEPTLVFENAEGSTVTGTGTFANVNLKNLTVVDETFYTGENGENAWEFTYLEFSGACTFNNVKFTDGIFMGGDSATTKATFTNCSFVGHNNDSSTYGNVTMYGAWVYTGTATFTNCSFTGTRGLKVADQYSNSDVTEVVVDACTFGPLSEKPGIAVDNRLGSLALTIKNSTFTGTQPGDQGNYIYENDNQTPNTTTITLENNTVVKTETVSNAEELKEVLAGAGSAAAGNTTISITKNLDLSDEAWTPIEVDGYHGADIVTIEGNGNTITGLSAPLFAGGFAGGSGIVIKNLTIADSNIVSTNTIGSGAFIESIDSMDTITLENCHLVNSTVTGGDGSRTGGLIGWTAGYNNVNDGPVKTYVTIKNCSVVGNTITCNGSVGAIYGHAGNNAWTYSTVENCVVKDNTLTSTDDGEWRVGVVVGTANVGELTINNITSSGNVLSQTEKTAPVGQSDLYGRFVPGETGKLVIDGVEIQK